MPEPVARMAISEPFSQDTCGHMLQGMLDLGPGMCSNYYKRTWL